MKQWHGRKTLQYTGHNQHMKQVNGITHTADDGKELPAHQLFQAIIKKNQVKSRIH